MFWLHVYGIVNAKWNNGHVFEIGINAVYYSCCMQYGVSISISQLLYHGQVLWLNTKGEQVAKQGWKKGLGPPVLCFGTYMYIACLTISIQCQVVCCVGYTFR